MNYYNKYNKYKNKYINYQIGSGLLDGLIKPIQIIRKYYTTGIKPTLNNKCFEIQTISRLANTGRNNKGIGFIEPNIFLKFGADINDFIRGYFLSTLKPIYPYFINVYGFGSCELKNKSENRSELSDVLIAEKGTETIYRSGPPCSF